MSETGKCWRCDVHLHSGNDVGICRLCEIEVDTVLESLVKTWRYSENRLFRLRGQKIYPKIKREVYSTLLYTYMWQMRMVDQHTRKPIDVFQGDYRDAAGMSMLANVNSKDFLAECLQTLTEQQLAEPHGEKIRLFHGVPDCTI